MEDENAPTKESPAPEPATTPEAAAAPLSQDGPKAEAPEQAALPKPPVEERLPPVGNVLLFGKYDVSGVTLRDAGMARYIDVTPVSVPHTGGRHTSKAFGKAKMSIVERLINNMMRTEDFTGKKMKSYKAVEEAFGIIAKKTNQNPLQLLVDALQNTAPREEVTRLQYGGISVPKAVDVAPARRVDLALRHLCRATLETSHKSKKPIGECLADEIIAAAKNDINSASVAKKEEIERVAASAR
ncbi:MAG: 30S ribosomal protein S7 [Candidatus Thermoplasmatota archaeon]